MSVASVLTKSTEPTARASRDLSRTGSRGAPPGGRTPSPNFLRAHMIRKLTAEVSRPSVSIGTIGVGGNTMANDYDLVIRNGTMIDGTGAQPREADVAVRDGRIATVGKVTGA